MSNENTGGPAFPCEVDPEQLAAGAHQIGHRLFPQYGMALRDYFAAKAMQAIYLPGITDDQLAAYAYAMADAMLKERAK